MTAPPLPLIPEGPPVTPTRLCTLDQIPEEDGLRVDVAGREPVAVWLVEGQVHVTDDTCTHGKASLTGDGLRDGFEVECGLHLGAFDIRDGRVTSAPCTIPLRVYRCWVEDGAVFADLAGAGENAT